MNPNVVELSEVIKSMRLATAGAPGSFRRTVIPDNNLRNSEEVNMSYRFEVDVRHFDGRFFRYQFMVVVCQRTSCKLPGLNASVAENEVITLFPICGPGALVLGPRNQERGDTNEIAKNCGIEDFVDGQFHRCECTTDSMKF